MAPLKNIAFQSIHHRLTSFFRKNEFLLLLIILSAFLLLPSFVRDSKAKDTVIYTLLILALLIGVYELADSKRSFLPGMLLAILTIVLNSFEFSENENMVFLLRIWDLSYVRPVNIF